MPPVRTLNGGTRPRQDPVSCRFCRIKKLKCDRQRPCSNCSARKVACEFKGEAPRPPGSAPTDTPDDITGESRPDPGTVHARLRRLEQAVFGDQPLLPLSMPEQNHLSATTAISTPPKQPQNDDERADQDSTWLEAIGNRSEAALPQFTDPSSIHLQTLEETITADQRRPQTRRIELPTHDIAITCLNAYAEHLDAVQHIMHVESTRTMIDKVYAQIQAHQTPDPGALCLILSLCANVGFYYTLGLHHEMSIFGDTETASALSTEWTKQALVAMDQARIAISKTTLEAIQASIMLTFLFYHLEGFTFRDCLMHGTSMAMARDLGLHKTDLPGYRPPDYTQAAIIETEVRRKLWWHLTCTEWFLAYMGGAHEGLYAIHPRQMCVRVPRHITREDLNTQGADFQRSLSEPTVMAYFLQRVRLAETCRECADAMFQLANPDTANYAILRALDARFESQLQELPRFLRFDLSSEQLRLEYGDSFDTQTSTQGIMINLMVNTRRCRLHLPFLIRAKSDPQFDFSRRMGLQAARSVFNVRRTVMADGDPSKTAHFKLGGMVQHIFYATVVLVMDVCVNKLRDDHGQLAEVREALRVMEEAKDSTQMGARFYDSLMAVLRKHHVKLPNTENSRQSRMNALRTAGPGGMSGGGAGSYDLHGNRQPVQSYPMPNGPANGLSSGVGAASTPLDGSPYDGSDYSGFAMDSSMWQDFLEQGPMLEAHDWDALLSDLDMRMG